MMRKLVLRWALPLCGLALSMGLPATGALAASAIAMDPDSQAFAYHLGDNVKQLEGSAVKACQSLGGKDCSVIQSCRDPGYGAVAIDRGEFKMASACGLASKSAASAQALDKCASAGGGDCAIAAEYHDTIPSFSVEQAYFKGRWASYCRAKISYQVEFFAAREFRLRKNNCRLFSREGKCLLRRTSPQVEVYSPGVGEGNYISPTYGTRISKIDNDSIMMLGGFGSRRLVRCPE